MLTQSQVEEALSQVEKKDKMVIEILNQRKFLEQNLNSLNMVEKVFPSDANFMLVRFSNAKKVYKKLLEKQIIVRDRSSLIHCENCLRITVGTVNENEILITALKEIEQPI